MFSGTLCFAVGTKHEKKNVNLSKTNFKIAILKRHNSYFWSEPMGDKMWDLIANYYIANLQFVFQIIL